MSDQDGMSRRWGKSGSVALIAGPALGGFLLFGSVLPSPLIGGILGAMIGAAAGMLRNREIAKRLPVSSAAGGLATGFSTIEEAVAAADLAADRCRTG